MNTETTLKNKKYYTTRISSCENRQNCTEGYIISFPNQPKIFQNARFFKPEVDKVFVKGGKGWTKPKPNQIEKISFKKIETYQEILELVQKYGYRCASEMIGFQLSSYGDHYPISDIAKMETFGQPYIDWLEKIAEIDYLMLQYFQSELKLTIRNSTYDMWIDTEKGVGTWRNNPFFGFHIETCIFGTFPINPHINPVSWDETLWKVFCEVHPDYNTVDFSDTKAAEAAHKKFDSVSCFGWTKIMCGEDNATWIKENLHFKSTIINTSPCPA